MNMRAEEEMESAVVGDEQPAAKSNAADVEKLGEHASTQQPASGEADSIEEPGQAGGPYAEQEDSPIISELGFSQMGLISPGGTLVPEAAERVMGDGHVPEDDHNKPAEVGITARSDFGREEDEWSVLERRIQESREASTSGRDTVGVFR